MKTTTHRRKKSLGKDFSRKGEKAQSAAAFLEVFFAPLRLCGRNIFLSQLMATTNSTLLDYHTLNHVAAHDLVDDVHSHHHASKHRVAAVKMRLRRVCHKPLRAARVFARQRHPNHGTVVRHLIDLAADLIARPAVSIAPRIPILNHKIWHHPVDGDVAKIISLGKLNEVVYGKRGYVG